MLKFLISQQRQSSVFNILPTLSHILIVRLFASVAIFDDATFNVFNRQ